MKAKAGFWKEYTANFLVDEPRLRKLVQTLESARATLGMGAEVRFRVFRQDQSFFHTATVDEVLADDNIRGKEIIRLVIDLVPTEGESRDTDDGLAIIDFDSKDKQHRVFLGVHAPSRDWTFVLAEDLDAQISRSLAPRRFSFLATRWPNLALSLLSFSAATYMVARMLFQSSPPLTEAAIEAMTIEDRLKVLLIRQSLNASDFTRVSLAMVSTLILFAGIFETRPISRIYALFDRSAFYWGDMIDAYDRSRARAQRWAWGVVVAFIVSVAASLVVAWTLK